MKPIEMVAKIDIHGKPTPVRDVPLNELPNELEPGDCFLYSDGRYVPAPEETAKRQAKIKKLMKSMWNDK